MPLLETVGAYATIVSLIGQFKQERKDASSMSDQEFLKWLTDHHHVELKKTIQDNRDLQTGIAKLLLQDHRVINEKIDVLAGMMSQVAGQIGEFRSVFNALAPGQEVEPEVLKMLRDLVENDWKRFSVVGLMRGATFLKIAGECREMEFDDQFYQQDLEKLVALGFLDYSSGAHQKNFALTRAAYKYVKAIGGTVPA